MCSHNVAVVPPILLVCQRVVTLAGPLVCGPKYWLHSAISVVHELAAPQVAKYQEVS